MQRSGWMSRVGVALRAASSRLRALAWPGMGGQGSSWTLSALGTLPGTQFDYQELGRDAAGAVREFWYLPHWQVAPLYPSDGSEFQTGWLYTVNGRRFELRLEDVVHFRFGIDPTNQRLGVSRLYPVLREVATDNAISTMLGALFRNMGVPGVLISPADGQTTVGQSLAE